MNNNQKTVKLKFNSKIIDQLGTDMYQHPVAAIAELISNAWDADAENVEITYPTENITEPGAEIIIKDDGSGMSFEDFQNKYLNVGYNRRGKQVEATTPQGRRIMGRKGLGKFAGFGIASLIEIESISEATGERFVFKMDLEEFQAHDEDGTGFDFTEKEWPVETYEASDLQKCSSHGTTIKLKKLTLSQNIRADFPQSMARRFFLHNQNSSFHVTLNGVPIPDDDTFNLIKYDFPNSYTPEEKQQFNITIEDNYAVEQVNGQEIKWRIAFTATPANKELNGISIFASNKTAQNPFFFNLTGNISAQHALAYLVGHIRADFVDSFPKDMIGPERQRINWSRSEVESLQRWGQNKIKELTNIWKSRQAEAKQRIIEGKIDRFHERLSRLQPSEGSSLKKALKKIAAIDEINEDKFEVFAESLLIATENGRLQQLIFDIGEQEQQFDAAKFLELLAEEKILSAVQIGETIYNKIQTLKTLYEKINSGENENPLRDFIADYPWILSPKYETFLKETNLKNIIINYFNQIPNETDLAKTEEHFRKRVDLILINEATDELVIVEFMKPDQHLDLDHISRTELYMNIIKKYSDTTTSPEHRKFKLKAAYIIADGLAGTIADYAKTKTVLNPPLFIMNWDTMLLNTKKDFKEYLVFLTKQAPDDFRIKAMKENLEELGA